MKTKFRAWDNVKGCMYYLGEDENVVFAFVSSGIIATDITEREDEFSLLHHLQYMQYTGLNDSNGVEIYEGDVVSHDQGEYSFVGYVARDCYTFFIKGISQLESLGFEDVADTSKGTADLTIIGNIHENSELLEGE